MLDYRLELITTQAELSTMAAHLSLAPALALDIETINWWDRAAERVALIQLAFRADHQLRVAVIDALAAIDFEPLRMPLELPTVPKAIHNADYDAVRLARHFGIHPAPIHDTMRAARRSGETRYSLQALAQAHLGLQLDKREQRGAWGRRPLTTEQLRYAALDAVCTLLLYEDQMGRGLGGHYQPRDRTHLRQPALPLSAAVQPTPARKDKAAGAGAAAADLAAPALALLGVVTELAGRYSPERLAVSAGSARVGLAGWIIDRALGAATELDEGTAKLELVELCDRGLVRLNAARRLEATEAGARLWHQVKPA